MLKYLTGGRPMLPFDRAFTDSVSGKPVFYCLDAFDRVWLAEGPWSWFRVSVEPRKAMKLREAA